MTSLNQHQGLIDRGGNIGYCARPSERGKGYGHTLLQMTLEQARGLELARVLIIPQRNNLRSHAMIERQSGVLEPSEDSDYRRYWVTLDPMQDNL